MVRESIVFANYQSMDAQACYRSDY